MVRLCRRSRKYLIVIDTVRMVYIPWVKRKSNPPIVIARVLLHLGARALIFGDDMPRPVKRGNVTFELNMQGLNQLMKSDEMKSILQEAGDMVANSASAMTHGEPYGVDVHDAQWVSIASIYGESEEAKRENYEKNILLKALGSTGLPTKK